MNLLFPKIQLSVTCTLIRASIRQTPCHKMKTLLKDALPKLHGTTGALEPSSCQIDGQLESLPEPTKAGKPPAKTSSTSACCALFQNIIRDTLDIELELLKKHVIRLKQEKSQLIAENKKLSENLAIKNHQINLQGQLEVER